MACPKKKTSHRKQHQRRAKNWKAILANIATCSNCGQPKVSHLACTSCGYYNGREYLLALPRKQRKATA